MDFSWEYTKPTAKTYLVAGGILVAALISGYTTGRIELSKQQATQSEESLHHSTDSLSEIIIKDNDLNQDGSLDRKEIDNLLEYYHICPDNIR